MRKEFWLKNMKRRSSLGDRYKEGVERERETEGTSSSEAVNC